MDVQALQILVGFICTAVFATSKVPMLLKAVRTRDLQSYSLEHIAMNTGGNLLYWVYGAGLPAGSVWVLQAFFTVVKIWSCASCACFTQTVAAGQRSNLSARYSSESSLAPADRQVLP